MSQRVNNRVPASIDIHGPKDLHSPAPDQVAAWARNQLVLASQIVDNPGGGLVFATQGIGQARAGLLEIEEPRWEALISVLHEAEDAAQHREYERCRELLAEGIAMLGDDGG
jgi:hypothetical protein